MTTQNTTLTAKEKAKELVENMFNVDSDINSDRYGFDSMSFVMAKQCALIACSEIIKQQEEQARQIFWSNVNYWQEVKQEIENM